MATNPNTLMAMATRLRQYGSDVPFGLALSWVRARYQQLIDCASDGWSFQFGFGSWPTFQSIMGTCQVTQLSNIISNAVPANGLATVAVANGGAGYQVGDILTVLGGSFGTVTVLALNGGAVATVAVTTAGYNYNGGPFATIGGSGTGAVIDIVTTGPGTLPGNRTSIVGRQVLINGMSPFYDIVDNGDGRTFTISEAYQGVSGTVEFEISSIYFTPNIANADFESLRCWIDPPNNNQLPFSFTMEEINNIDPQRTSANQPYLLADAGWNGTYLAALPDGVVDQNGYTNNSAPVPRKETYPRQQSNYLYRYIYKKRLPELTDPSDRLPGFLRGDIIFEGALADLSLWEGTAVMPRRANPVVANMHEARFRQLIQDAQIVDGSVMQRTFTNMLGMTRLPYPAAFWSSAFAQRAPWLSVSDEFGSSAGFEIY